MGSKAIGVRSMGDALYWCSQSMHCFVNTQDKTTLEVVDVPFILFKDPFLQLERRMGLTVELKIAGKS